MPSIMWKQPITVPMVNVGPIPTTPSAAGREVNVLFHAPKGNSVEAEGWANATPRAGVTILNTTIWRHIYPFRLTVPGSGSCNVTVCGNFVAAAGVRVFRGFASFTPPQMLNKLQKALDNYSNLLNFFDDVTGIQTQTASARAELTVMGEIRDASGAVRCSFNKSRALYTKLSITSTMDSEREMLSAEWKTGANLSTDDYVLELTVIPTAKAYINTNGTTGTLPLAMSRLHFYGPGDLLHIYTELRLPSDGSGTLPPPEEGEGH